MECWRNELKYLNGDDWPFTAQQAIANLPHTVAALLRGDG
jgi:hypothetical protein